MSINKIEQERLARILDFLIVELKDIKGFSALDYSAYQNNRPKRREVERCIENIVNSALDVAKIILIHKEVSVPDTYRDYFLKLLAVGISSKSTAFGLAKWVKLRNILAHEYLDIRWNNIKEFINEGYIFFQNLLKDAQKYLKSQQKEKL
ncbi:MAG: DUF86 domain-containing protein [Armatimonadetes bacterium]|nr:DUF86 domain-containing protein [Armatimonadota bacterium]